MQSIETIVYSPLVVNFVQHAQEFNALIELSDSIGLKDFIDRAHLLLPKLYAAMVQLPRFDSELADEQQRFVTQEDYEYQHNQLVRKLGSYDSYEEISTPRNDATGEGISVSLAENLCDIYQDTKDFALVYEIGTHELMYAALWEIQQAFENYWGHKAVSVLRALHYLRYSNEEIEENDQKPAENTNFSMDTSQWFISRRQQDLSDE